jgi:hypothetical protein
LVDHVSDEFDAGCAANLVVAFEAAFEVENETFEQQLADIGKLERGRSSIKISTINKPINRSIKQNKGFINQSFL